jgi:hypothetical protein
MRFAGREFASTSRSISRKGTKMMRCPLCHEMIHILNHPNASIEHEIYIGHWVNECEKLGCNFIKVGTPTEVAEIQKLTLEEVREEFGTLMPQRVDLSFGPQHPLTNDKMFMIKTTSVGARGDQTPWDINLGLTPKQAQDLYWKLGEYFDPYKRIDREEEETQC